MSGALIDAAGLAAAVASDRPPAVLDATLLLASPEFDGDHRAESGEPRWRAAHIPGSRHVDLRVRFHDPASPWHFTHPSPDAVAAELAGLGITADRRVVVYDSVGGLWAARLWYLLRWIGHDVAVLDGGLAAWTAADLPVASGAAEASTAVAPWRPAAVREAWIERDAVLAGGHRLVCGLAGSAFRGTAPTRYSRRGHIPGSANVVARGLVDDGGRIRDAAAVLQAFVDGGVPVTADAPPIVLYCGGGISAALAALALAVAGVDDVRIYDGSLEEWSADPSLPIETDAA